MDIGGFGDKKGSSIVCTNEQTDRQTEERTDRSTDRRTNRQTDREKNEQTEERADTRTNNCVTVLVLQMFCQFLLVPMFSHSAK